MWTRLATWTLGAILVCSSPALGQTDFTSTGLNPGDLVFLTTPAGEEISGRVVHIEAERLTLNGLEFQPEPRLLIERRGDSVKDGACKGMVIGSLLTFAIAASNGTHMNDIPALLMFYAGPHAFWGAAIDWLHTGRTTVFGGSPASGPVPDQAAVVRMTITF